ncbi:YoaK family protein [Streptomyces sp. NPDC002889]|uniref:YoaK family protein n=1 Tax=Streptomyces sp. NPDC002889 TaxID=3364669 RepID=UPI00368E87F2
MQSRPGVLTSLVVALTVTTGVVEAVSFLVLGPVFTAMQTANVLFLAFGTVGEGGLSTLAPSVSLGAFAVGTVIGARMESRLEPRGHQWLIPALVIEGLLIAAAGFAAWGLEPSHGTPSARHVLVIGILATAMGFRNVTAMRLHVPDLPTNVLTRAMTVMLSGSPLGHDVAFGYGSGATRRRVASVLAMFAGGLVGACLVQLEWPVPATLFLVAAVVLILAALYVSQPRFPTT